MRNEKGSITLFVLVSMIFFLIIATTAYVSASNKLQGQNEELAQIKASYEQNLGDAELLQLYNKVSKTREWLPGSGTQEDSYKIYTIEDLVELSNRTNDGTDYTGKFVELMNDLDFNQDSSYVKATRTDFGDVNDDGTLQDLKTELTTGQGFKPIGISNALSFKGTFDGNNYTIKHLYIDREKSTSGYGLFGQSYTVQNLTVKDGYVKGGRATGGIVGVLRGSGEIRDCHNDNTTVILREGNNYVAGGVVGQISTGTEGIFNCTNSGQVVSYGVYEYNNSKIMDIGGIARPFRKFNCCKRLLK